MLTLSGFEGVGKSTLINKLKDYSGDYTYHESARYFIPLEDNILSKSKDVISYKCLLSDLNILRFFMENKMNNVILDRNIVDALVYLDMYYPHLKMDYKGFKSHLQDLCGENGLTHLHNTSVLIRHPQDKIHVKKIISDPIRKYNSTVQEYIEGAKKWEDKYLEYMGMISEMICETFMIVNAYPEEKEGVNKIIKAHYEE